MDIIIIILICLLILGGVFDFVFNLIGISAKIFCSIILIIAAIYLGIKLLIVFIPWVFIIALITLIVGIGWLIKSIIKK